MRKPPPTWDEFKSAVRKVDRESLLIQAAAASALLAKDAIPDEWRRGGVTPWNVADVARTALAWGRFQGKRADAETLMRLANMNVQIADGPSEDIDSSERLARILARTFFEQFPSQRSVLPEFARTILLFGSAVTTPREFTPEAMHPRWFENATAGLTLHDYVESIFFISVGAMENRGQFDPEWLDGPQFKTLADVISLEVVTRVFTERLLTGVDEFKAENRSRQESLPAYEKKYAFDPLDNKPFIHGIAEAPITPAVHAVIAKALPPAVYHLGLAAYGEAFTRDLGTVFQHYAGRQLELVKGDRSVVPEVAYGPRREQLDSCDWFLDLPDLLVLVECKARQPIESLRTGSSDWLNSVEGSIGKGIKQINRSNAHIDRISDASAAVDRNKRRVGLVVTLEPFYLNQNPFIWDRLGKRDLPVGVVSVSELELLVCLDAEELARVLADAANAAQNGTLLLHDALDAAAATGRDNSLLVGTWDAVGLFRRLDNAAEGLGISPE
ncbi:hypothetical protein [Frigoribacterium sp. MEB024]|uniref:hypothetical protein n=1 Tax=Frigoribacterium sp. MEB024 TaxID=1589899 RepID=UPI000AF1C892|nr:hypothetical protein [Frigoribacterium sp. MEB024]